MVKSYERKRTRKELIESFKLAIKRKQNWLEEHDLESFNITSA